MNQAATSQIVNHNTIHVSYTPADSDWKERIVDKIRSLQPFVTWEFPEDSRSLSRELWEEETNLSLDSASALMLLISAEFFASDFIRQEKLPYLIKQAEIRKLPVFPIIVSPCNWQEYGFIAEQQIFPRDRKPLSEISEAEINDELESIAREIGRLLQNPDVSNSQAQEIYSPAQSFAEEVIESPSEEIFEDSEEPDLFPLDNDVNLDLSPTIETIVMRVEDMLRKGLRRVPVSTSILLFAIAEHGFEKSAYQSTSFLSSFLRNQAGDRYEQVRDTYLQVRGLQLQPNEKSIARLEMPPMTVTFFNTFEKAEEIALRMTESKRIHARHVLASLIIQTDDGEKTGAQIRLDEMGISLPQLRADFLEYLRGIDAANINKWEIILAERKVQGKRNLRFSGYDSDDTRGEEDWLNIDDDVNAFAALIASRTVMPPLSIGLFGEWGSGKTFFMRRLRKRIDTLSRVARASEKMQKDVPYYKRIAQIEFNAWHYVEGNLWASLVEHIFDNLRVADEKNKKVISDLQQHLINQLNIEKIAAQQATDKVDNAKKELNNTEAKLNEVKKQLDDNSRELQSVRATDILATIDLSDPALRSRIDNLLSELNINRVGDAAQSFVGALGEARALMERGNNLLTPLVRAKDKGRRLFWLILCLVAAPAAGLLLVLIRHYSQTEWISESITVLTGLATLLLSVAAWIQRQASWVSKWLGRAEQAKQQIDAKIAESQAAIRKKITELENEFTVSKAQYDSALREKEAAVQRVAEAEAELKEATSEKLLAKFIQDRAASDDYRKHLGVLAIIRDDFENLSNYIETQNRRLTELDPNQDCDEGEVKKFTTLDEEKVEQDKRINRIVLYIDDLDRCPPNKVVDVLQAVHLLLAFPLFVVVVGVDARWITRSLKTKYKELLHGSDSQNGKDDKNDLIGVATPDDYLEKIFQIPFWLQPMDKDACKKMVSGLLKNNLTQKPSSPLPAASQKTNGDNSPTEMPREEKTGDRRKTPDETAAETKTGGETKIPSQNIQAAETIAASATATETEDKSENLLSQQHLEILAEEQKFIGELTSLLGRSPRALKRFVNIYRLIKAGLSEDEINSFLSEETGVSDFEAVLFLLALDTGLPAVSEDLFQYFQKIYSGSLKIPEGARIGWLEEEIKDASSADWRRLKPWLEKRQEMWSDKARAKRIGKWVSRVSRYSFQTQKI